MTRSCRLENDTTHVIAASTAGSNLWHVWSQIGIAAHNKVDEGLINEWINKWEKKEDK